MNLVKGFFYTSWYGHVVFLCKLLIWCNILMGFPCSSASKDSACNAGDQGSISASPESYLACPILKTTPQRLPIFYFLGKIPWRRKWQPTPVFLLGESHGRRSLVGYSPRGRKESDTTERLHFHWLSLCLPNYRLKHWTTRITTVALYLGIMFLFL